VLERLLPVIVGPFVGAFVLPDGGNPHDLDRLGRGGVDFDLGAACVDAAEEGTRVLDVELVVLELEDLVLVHVELGIRFQEGPDRRVHDCSTRVVQPPQRHQVYSLQHVGLRHRATKTYVNLNLLGASDHRLRCDFPELMRLARSHIKLDVSYLEVGGLLQDPGSHLEERHQQLVLNQLEIDALRRRVNEVTNNSVFVAKKHHVFKFINTTILIRFVYYFEEEESDFWRALFELLR